MKIKRNKKSYRWFLCGLILVVVLTISYRVSKANYRISNSIELTTGKVVSSPYDFNIVAMYIDGVEQDKSTLLPSIIANYTINENETFCYKDSKSNKDSNAKISINVLGELIVKGISKGSKCILSLNTKINSAKTMSELLESHYTINTNRSAENKDFNVPFDKTTYGVLYSAPDDDGTSYYFAGNPLDNWVEFGGYYWRIIRINGNGSIRMIYQGRTEDKNGKKLEAQATGEETQIGTSAFNNKSDNNAYVGYFYTLGQLRGLDNPSNAYTTLNNWFSNSNIKQGSQYYKYIEENAGFCGDRTPYIDYNGKTQGGGIGTNLTFYGAWVRLLPSQVPTTLISETIRPTFNCADSNDLYTYNISSKDNKQLDNPVGLITADEIVYAGLIFNSNKTVLANYLVTGNDYWTLSPCGFNNTYIYAGVLSLHSKGYFEGRYTNTTLGVRPIINLRKDVTFTGDGTQSNPYKVVV